MKKTFKKFPRYTSDNRPFRYYASHDGNDMTEVAHTEFLHLLCAVPDSDSHIYIDRESGIAIFFEDASGVNDLLTFSRRDFNREAKRQERAHQCVMKGTRQCDGWKPDENGRVACDACMRHHTARTISIDAPINSGDEGEPTFLDFPSDEDATARLFDEADRAVLQDALAALPEADREYLLARYQPDMTARKLAETYGIADYRYANRKAQRILDRVIRRLREIEE